MTFQSSKLRLGAPKARRGCATEEVMPKYIIERDLAGAGQLNATELNAIAKKSCDVLRKMASDIQWLESYITGNKIYCLYIAPNPELIREHAKAGDFPCTSVEEVKNIIDPTTAEPA